MENVTKSPRLLNFDHPSVTNIPLNDKHPAKDSISWKLWMNSALLAKEALDSKFIQGIKNGSLDPNKYGQYTIQDCAYCYHGVKDYQTLENRAIEMKLPKMASFANARRTSYETYYKEEIVNWHVKDPSALQLSEAASWYIQAEKNAFSKYHPIYGIIAMIPCDQLWSWLAKEMEPSKEESGVYRFWIEQNTGSTGAYRLDNFIDEWFKENPHTYDPKLANYIFQCSMTGEVNFFRSACGQKPISLPKPPQ